MIKYILLITLPLLASVGNADTETYYKEHLNKLQRDISQCPERHPQHVTCDQLTQYALDANKLADELRNSPQDFGKKILSLQESQANILAALKNDPDQSDLKQSIHQTNKQIAERIAVVKWLESPKG